MLGKIRVIIYALSLCVSVSAELQNGSVTMSPESSGYLITEDSLIAPYTEESAPADLVIQGSMCTLSCPGACYSDVTGYQSIFQFQVPIDSVDFSVSIDTLDASLLQRMDSGMTIGAMTAEQFDDFAFMVRDRNDNFAIFRIVGAESTPPPNPPSPDNCYSISLISVTMNWVYQDDGTLMFDKPTATDPASFDHHVSGRHVQHHQAYITPVSAFPARVPVPAYDMLGRFCTVSPFRRPPVIFIKR
jgi:hypothetical protein